MDDIVASFSPEAAAKLAAEYVHKVLDRDYNTPGQWEIAERYWNRIYQDTITGKQYKVSDYL